jgi:hypothetical protein
MTVEDNGLQAANMVMERTRKALKYAGVTDNKTIKEIATIAYSDIANHLTVDTSGIVRAISIDEVKKQARRAVKKIREKRRILSSLGTEKTIEATLEFELYDKVEGLKTLISLQGLKPPEVHKIQFDEATFNAFLDGILEGLPEQLRGPVRDATRAKLLAAVSRKRD